MKSDSEFTIKNDVDLRNRLNIIIQAVRHFWEQAPYTHFTNHGPSHSERIHQKLGQLNQELPEDQRLNEDEIFIVSAAAWLYEIGMQSTNLTPIVNFKYQPGVSPTFAQLQQIRERKHLLTERMILDSISGTHEGSYLHLGLTPDRYTRLIADVCRGISNEPLKNVNEQEPVQGVMVRLRLLVALLRLADQLYIDSTRVNLELLQAANLPPEQLAHWWAYHYTQTLPIHRGQIRFHYFLPSVHKPLLGHIRALIEPAFEHGKNPTLSYLWDYGLRLIPQKHPNVSFEQQAGFQHEMSPGLVSYLRGHVTPITEEDKEPEPEEEEKKVEESLLLVLDYENFLLQLGLQGYFPTPEEMSRLLVTLPTEAQLQHAGLIDSLAVGHWKRPDLVPTARLLEARLYRLLTAEDHEKSSEVLKRELSQLMESASPPKQMLLVTPDEEMAPFIRRFTERRQVVSAWISDLPEADIYRLAARNVKSLPQVLGLTDLQSLNAKELEAVQTACILKLDERLAIIKDGLSIDEVSSVLERIEHVHERVNWWRLWLVNKEILKLEHSRNGHILKLNAEHPTVITVREKRSVVITTLQSLAQGDEGVQQDDLLHELSGTTSFRDSRDDKEGVVKFLMLLKDENALHLIPSSSLSDSQAVWQLNPTHWAMLALNADRYLPLLVLGIDHYLVREGYSFIHEHTLTYRLAKYIDIGDSAIEAVYHMALEKGWVQRRQTNMKHKYRDENLVEVRLVEGREEVRKVMLNRDILLDVLYHKSSAGGLERDMLLSILSQIRRFTRDRDEVNQWRDEVNQWLSIFQRESLITVEEDAHNIGHDCLQLNLESPLVYRLLGRLNIWGIIQQLRIMGAIFPDRAKPSGEIIESLTRYITYRDIQLATWTLDYAKSIHLVEIPNRDVPNNADDFVYLNKQHRFVRALDQREQIVFQALSELMKALSRRFRDGLIPLHIVTQEMEKDTSRLGYTRNEYDYWLSLAASNRHKLIEKHTERTPGRPSQIYFRLLPQERH